MILQETMGHRMKKIHMISGSKVFEAMLTVFKQGLSAKLKERIVVHQGYESLYEHVPKECLPKDFGGEQRSIAELHGMLLSYAYYKSYR